MIDIGPEAGINGGNIVAQGEIKTIKENKNSITGSYLSKKKNISIFEKQRFTWIQINTRFTFCLDLSFYAAYNV